MLLPERRSSSYVQFLNVPAWKARHAVVKGLSPAAIGSNLSQGSTCRVKYRRSGMENRMSPHLATQDQTA